MNFVSLFAGVGGFDLAFERAGMDCVGQVEIDAKCREVLAKHWPEVPRWEDVHDVTANRIQMAARGGRWDVGDRNGNGSQSGNDPDPGSLLRDGGIRGGFGTVDILCGGFPCQDYSVAGKRGGLAGDRGALWWQFHRLIDECRPRWVVGENVPGLLSSNGGRDFGAIVGSLVELGYGVVWRVLDAQYFGVAQRRRRVFIVGHIGGIPRPEVLSIAEGCSGDSPPIRETGTQLAPTLASRSRGGGGLGTDTELDGGLIASALDTRPGDRQRPEGLIAFNWQSGQDQLSARETHVDALHAGQTPAIFNPYRTMTGPFGGGLAVRASWTSSGLNPSTYSPGPPLVLQDVRGMAKAQNGAGVSDEGVAYTLDQTGAQGVATSSVRRLTPLECERLQGFPDNWTAGQSDTQRYRQMGNAVAVPVVEWIGKQLVKAE